MGTKQQRKRGSQLVALWLFQLLWLAVIPENAPKWERWRRKQKVDSGWVGTHPAGESTWVKRPSWSWCRGWKHSAAHMLTFWESERGFKTTSNTTLFSHKRSLELRWWNAHKASVQTPCGDGKGAYTPRAKLSNRRILSVHLILIKLGRDLLVLPTR